jgi:hypothetical protein
MSNLNLFFDIPKEDDDPDFTDYLVHCYLYYESNNPVIYDYDFDQLCKTLLSKWDKVTHKYKDLVNLADLKAGTGYNIKKYPKDIIEDAERRKEIFLKELKVEVDRIKEEEKEDKDFEFTNTLMETYLLCGLYKDFRHYGRKFDSSKAKAKLVIDELKKKYNLTEHKEEIKQYCKDHNVALEFFNL